MDFYHRDKSKPVCCCQPISKREVSDCLNFFPLVLINRRARKNWVLYGNGNTEGDQKLHRGMKNPVIDAAYPFGMEVIAGHQRFDGVFG